MLLFLYFSTRSELENQIGEKKLHRGLSRCVISMASTVSTDTTFASQTEASQPDSSNTGPNADMIFKNVMYIGIGVIGVCSNGFVIFIILNTRAMKKKFANWFVINQSVIDFCASIFLIFDTTSFALVTSFEGWSGELTCRLWSSAFLLWGTFISSTYNLVVISLERYLGVCHPVWHHKHFSRKAAIFFLFAPWLIGFVIEMFIPLVTNVQNGSCVLYQFPTKFAQKAHGIFIIIIDYIFPFLFMVFCYVSTALKIHKLPNTSNKVKKRTELNVLKTLIIVCTCYVLCHLTSQVNYLRFNMGYTIEFHSWYYYLGVTGVNLNCCINPFIYAFKYEAFKNGMRNVLLRQTTISPGSTTATSNSNIDSGPVSHIALGTNPSGICQSIKG